MSVDWLGDFRAYEIVTDLRHTCVLEGATDIMVWANPGPGALLGASFILGVEKNSTKAFRGEVLELMRELTRLANEPDAGFWPGSWPRWEMREAEHTLCEYSKYVRGQRGERLKRRFSL